MFQRMNHGVMDAQTGLCVVMKQIGCLQPAPDAPGRGDESAARDRKRMRSKSVVVRLGRRLKPYAFASDTVPTKQLLQRFLEIADRYAPRLAWPTHPDQVIDFADALRSFAQDLRKVTVPSTVTEGDTVGLPGGRDPWHA